MSTSDDILLQRCRDGDQHAWDTLIRRYGPLVRSVARRFNLPQDVCDDICQSAFQTLVENLAALRGGATLSGWLAAVTRRHCFRYLERLAAPPPAPPEVEPPPNQALEEWEERRELQLAIEQLPSPCRDLIHALFLDPTCPAYAEIARRLNRPIGSLGPMRQRCLTRLARRLLEVDDTPASQAQVSLKQGDCSPSATTRIKPTS